MTPKQQKVKISKLNEDIKNKLKVKQADDIDYSSLTDDELMSLINETDPELESTIKLIPLMTESELIQFERDFKIPPRLKQHYER